MNKAGLFATAIAISCATSACAEPAEGPREIHVSGNPILAEGEYYSTDPAPFTFDGKLWILAGRDEAAQGVNDFIMKEWQLLATDDPASGNWTHYPDIARPHDVFKWAEEGRAYAGQIVPGLDGRLYFYAPVLEKDSTAKDRFAIGVAVADSPTGPWRDAHPSGPIVSQQVPRANDIQNIDPTVLIDDDGRIIMYWGTFGQLRGVELAPDMVTPKGEVVKVDSLTGFFEAPWLMKRKGTYYMLYAGNDAGPDSECTPTVYHACIAYGTASSPLGPWTYRGVALGPVSSTTSHSGAAKFKGQYYLAYHTADAKNGGNFRRSVALDALTFDDSQTPPAINLVRPTKRAGPPPQPTRNIALGATATASNEPIPVQYWIKALNDGVAPTAPLPPDMWGNWRGDNPAQEVLEYRWDTPVEINGSRIWFFADQPAGSGIGVAPPKDWQLLYWNDGGWKPVLTPDSYPSGAGEYLDVSFPTITTRCLRVALTASTDGKSHAGMGVEEWEVLSPKAQMLKSEPAQAAEPCD